MKRRLATLSALALSPLALAAAEPAGSDIGIMVYAVGGTGGIGGGLGYHFNDVLTVRGELAGFSYGDTADKDGISYKGDLKLSTKALYLVCIPSPAPSA